MKILCAIDGKDYSLRAAHVACDLAKRLNAELTLCMVNPLLPGRAPIYLWPEEYITKVLAEMSRKAVWAGVKEVRGETWRAICVSDAIVEYADRCEIDYIIIGTSDRSGISRVLSGSVSRELTWKANCPVLIVHRVRGERPAGRRRRLRIRDLFSQSSQSTFSLHAKSERRLRGLAVRDAGSR